MTSANSSARTTRPVPAVPVPMDGFGDGGRPSGITETACPEARQVVTSSAVPASPRSGFAVPHCELTDIRVQVARTQQGEAHCQLAA